MCEWGRVESVGGRESCVGKREGKNWRQLSDGVVVQAPLLQTQTASFLCLQLRYAHLFFNFNFILFFASVLNQC